MPAEISNWEKRSGSPADGVWAETLVLYPKIS